MRNAVAAVLLAFVATQAAATTLKCRLVAVAGAEVCTACVDGVQVRTAESAALDVIGRKASPGGVVKLVLAGDVVAKVKVPRIRNRIGNLAYTDPAVCPWTPLAPEPVADCAPCPDCPACPPAPSCADVALLVGSICSSSSGCEHHGPLDRLASACNLGESP